MKGKSQFKTKLVSIITTCTLALSLMPGLALADTQSAEGNADTDTELVIPVTLSTEGGQWQDPEGTLHNNGTYILTVPRTITLTDAKLGSIDINENYTINVAGAIDNDKQVNVSIESTDLTCDSSAISMGVTQGKTTWFSEECVGTITDSKLSGTDSNETLNVNGTVTKIGNYTGTVTYNAEMTTVLPT